MKRRAQRAWRTFGARTAASSSWVLAGVVLVTGLAGIGLTRLEFATGDESYINEGSDVAIDNEAYQSRFGGETMIVLFTADEGSTVADLFTEPNLSALTALEDQVRDDASTFAVVSPLTALQFTENLVTRASPPTSSSTRSTETPIPPASPHARPASASRGRGSVRPASSRSPTRRGWSSSSSRTPGTPSPRTERSRRLPRTNG
jgi:hypothetical protein